MAMLYIIRKWFKREINFIKVSPIEDEGHPLRMEKDDGQCCVGGFIIY
jgi:hypothetical protein